MHLTPDWPTQMGHPDIWTKVAEIDDAELWETHQDLKMRLIRFLHRRLARQAEQRSHFELEAYSGGDGPLKLDSPVTGRP